MERLILHELRRISSKRLVVRWSSTEKKIDKPNHKKVFHQYSLDNGKTWIRAGVY